MKHFISCAEVSSLLLVTLLACQKQPPVAKNIPELSINTAKNYFEQQIAVERYRGSIFSGEKRSNSTRLMPTPVWGKAIPMTLGSIPSVWVPVHYERPFTVKSGQAAPYAYSISDVSWLIIYPDADHQLEARMLHFFPDTLYIWERGQRFSGSLLSETWQGQRKSIYRYEKGKLTHSSDMGLPAPGSAGPQANKQELSQTICFYAEGYNYSAADPQGVYWSELIGCETFGGQGPGTDPVPPGYGGIGGGGGSGGSGAEPGTGMMPHGDFTLPSADNPIPNVADYIKCFINRAGNDYGYQVSLCVIQPEPGTRTAWESTWPSNNNEYNPIFVGHTYLILTQTTPNGTVIRNLGFYPGGTVSPGSPRSAAVFNNDQNRDYDIKLTISMNNSQFFSVLSYITTMQQNGTEYNLNANNCSTFAINAINHAGFQLPKTQGVWYRGAGCNPGDLGEDIREMALSANMSRTTVTGTHPNQGVCQ